MLKSVSKTALYLGVAALFAASGAQAETVLKASHQFPGGKGDVRDEMVQILAREVEEANVGLEIQIYPGQSLYKADGTMGRADQGPARYYGFPARLCLRPPSAILRDADAGARAQSRHGRSVSTTRPSWRTSRRSSTKPVALFLPMHGLPVHLPRRRTASPRLTSIKGQVTRAAGPAFEQMLVGAGASISSMPSSEIYTGMQTGVLDAANTSSGSFVSYRLYEQVKCLTAPGDNALWFMYEPILMSKQTLERALQGTAGRADGGGQEGRGIFRRRGQEARFTKMVDIFKKAGVEVVSMSPEDYDAWLAIAKETSYKSFAEKVPGGDELIDKALAVD